eukprot:3837515-Amphidinium_carterae.1
MPKLTAYLVKHPALWNSMNINTLKFLRRTVERAAQTQREARRKSAEQDPAGNHVLVLGNLHPSMFKPQISDLLQQFGLGSCEVDLPRESL